MCVNCFRCHQVKRRRKSSSHCLGDSSKDQVFLLVKHLTKVTSSTEAIDHAVSELLGLPVVCRPPSPLLPADTTTYTIKTVSAQHS